MQGSLTCVGVGMTLGAHITPICKSYIEQADIVFSLMSNGVVELWLDEMNDNVISLQKYYEKDISRNISYQNMVKVMMEAVYEGKKVVGAFYGHPGVFAKVPHLAIETARKEGFEARMEAGISAEDCLFSDLGIDPGKYGFQQFETSQFMFYQRVIDPSAYLVLWQLGVAGDKTLKKLTTNREKIQILIDLLEQSYPNNHEVILYQAKVLPIDETRTERVNLHDLVDADIFQHTTLVIPPCKKMVKNDVILAKLESLTNQL